MSIKQRIEDAAGEYDKWPRSMKEAFRLSTVVDRIPPTLQHGVALLGEIDRLESLLTAANACISELTQCDPSWFDASPADAFRMWAEDKKRLTAATERAEKAESQRDRMREALEVICALVMKYDIPAAWESRELAQEALKGVGDE